MKIFAKIQINHNYTKILNGIFNTIFEMLNSTLW
jgi:hypothetical protein